MTSEPQSPELWRRIERAAGAIDPQLSDRDVERLVAGARRLRQRRATRRALTGVALVAVIGTTGAAVWWKGAARDPIAGDAASARDQAQVPAPASGRAAPAERSTGRAVRLPDGSVAMPMDDGTELTLRESSEHRVAIDLERGRGRFEVTPRSERTFSVRAGDVSVTVLGTIFTVERVADRIGVGVERGRVLVDWGTGSTRLGAGERGWFPPLQVGPSDAATATVAIVAPTAPTATPPAPTAAPRPGARALSLSSRATSPNELGERRAARAGRSPAPPAPAVASAQPLPEPPSPAAAAPDPVPSPSPSTSPPSLSPPPPTPAVAAPLPPPRPLDRTVAAAPPPPAVEALSRPSPGAPDGDSMDALLEAADAARLDGHATDATALLRRAIALHPSDGRAPLAAFTLGRVLLVKVGRPHEAAAAFARARELAPDGPLAEDALAREVEAWSGAHETARARARADEYLRRYPSGRRVRTVRAFGGLE